MARRFFRATAAAASLLTLTSCAGPIRTTTPTTPATTTTVLPIVAAERRWAAAGITSYTIEVNVCCMELYGQWRVEVRDRVVVSAVKDGEDVGIEAPGTPTVPHLFGMARQGWCEPIFDPAYGYPSTCDGPTDVTDGGGFGVKSFTPTRAMGG